MVLELSGPVFEHSHRQCCNRTSSPSKHVPYIHLHFLKCFSASCHLLRVHLHPRTTSIQNSLHDLTSLPRHQQANPSTKSDSRSPCRSSPDFHCAHQWCTVTSELEPRRRNYIVHGHTYLRATLLKVCLSYFDLLVFIMNAY